MTKPSFEETLTKVWRQALVENAKAVKVGGESYPVRPTPKRGFLEVVVLRFHLGPFVLLYEEPNNPRKAAQTGQKTNAQGQLFRGRIRSHRYKEGMERQYKHRKITGTHEESKSSEFHEAKNNTGSTNKPPTTTPRPLPHPPHP